MLSVLNYFTLCYFEAITLKGQAFVLHFPMEWEILHKDLTRSVLTTKSNGKGFALTML